MRSVAAFSIVALVAGVIGCSEGARTGAETPPPTSAVVALVDEGDAGSRLEWIDPGTLENLSEAPVRLSGGAWSPVFSPDGEKVAVGGRGNEGVRIVDVKELKLVDRVARSSVDRSLVPLAWPRANRLLALDFAWMQGPTVPHVQNLIAVDPITRRVLARQPLGGWAIHTAGVGDGVVLLIEPEQGIGPARLAVADENGDLRTVLLDRIVAGSREEESQAGNPRYHMEAPGLGVDPSGRAFVVPAGLVIAEVDIGTLAVSYRELSPHASLLSRLLDWLDPVAQAKAPPKGPIREARWLGEGLIASAGWNGLKPAGLSLIDLEKWTVRTVDEEAARFSFEAGVLLAYGDYSSSDGIRAYDLDGGRRWSAFEGEAIGAVQTLSGRAYVEVARGGSSSIAVIDLDSGTEVRRVRSEWPEFLIPEEDLAP